MRSWAWVALGLSLAACGGGGRTAGGSGATGPNGPNGPTGSSAVCLPVAPMQLTVLEHGREWEPVAALAADGSITESVSKRSGVAWVIAADELRDRDGKAKFSCDAQHVLHLGDGALSMRFDDGDALVGSDGSRIFVADSGEVSVALGGRAVPASWRVVGSSAATRRTAELLVLATMASARW